MNDDTIAAFCGVSKSYRRKSLFGTKLFPAVKDLSFELKRGEIYGLLGLNGAGKTTIMKLMTGLLFADQGTVTLFGFSPQAAEAKRRVGFLPELPYFYPYSTTRQSLLYYAGLSGLDKQTALAQVDAATKKTGLLPHAHKKVSEFSKGMMQRLGLAQAIVHDPELLILDEPVSGLDPLAIHEMRELIAGLNAAGKTILLSSHSISELEKISNCVFIMAGGRLAQTVKREDWENTAGGLEEIFVSVISKNSKEETL